MSKTQIVLATGEVYDVEDKGERRILIPVGYIKQEEEKHEQSDFDGTFNTYALRLAYPIFQVKTG